MQGTVYGPPLEIHRQTGISYKSSLFMMHRIRFAMTETDPTESDWLHGNLSKETQFRVLIKGEIGPKEIGKLIRLLEAQKAVLDDDDD